MENNIKTFEDFRGHTRQVNFSDLGDSWSAEVNVNKGMGKNPYVMGDQRIRDIEEQLEELKHRWRNEKEDDSVRSKISNEMYELSKQIPILKKDKENSIKQWVYKKSPSSSDRELYMTDDQAKEVNDSLNRYREERDKYQKLIDNLKRPSTNNTDFHRPKGEL